MDRNYDLSVGGAVACNVAGKSVYVRDQLCAVLSGRRSADAASPGNADAGCLALEGSENQLRLLSICLLSAQIETGPVHISHRVLEERGGVGQKRHRCRICQCKFLQLRRQKLIVRRGPLGSACDKIRLFFSIRTCFVPGTQLSVIVVKDLQKLLLYISEGSVFIVGNHMELRIRFALLVVKKFLQVIVKGAVVDLSDHSLLFLSQGCSQVTLVDHIQQTGFMFTIRGHFLLKRSRHIREITFACVVKKAGQHKAVRPLSGCRFPRAENAVLRDRPEFGHVPVPSAEERKRVRDIFDADPFRVRLRRIEADPRVGCNIVRHGYPFHCHFVLTGTCRRFFGTAAPQSRLLRYSEETGNSK